MNSKCLATLTQLSIKYCVHTVGDADAGVWGVVGGRVLWVSDGVSVSACRRGVLKPRSTVEGVLQGSRRGDNSTGPCSKGQHRTVAPCGVTIALLFCIPSDFFCLLCPRALIQARVGRVGVFL